MVFISKNFFKKMPQFIEKTFDFIERLVYDIDRFSKEGLHMNTVMFLQMGKIQHSTASNKAVIIVVHL